MNDKSAIDHFYGQIATGRQKQQRVSFCVHHILKHITILPGIFQPAAGEPRKSVTCSKAHVFAADMVNCKNIVRYFQASAD
jgi:hypothetical protein